MLTLACVTAVCAADDPVRVFVGTSEVALRPHAVYRDGEVYAPSDILASIGAICESTEDSKLKITAADGSVTESPLKTVRGARMIPLTAIADDLGAFPEWDETSRTLSLRAKVQGVEYTDGTFSVRLGYPVQFLAREFPNPRRLVVDLLGARQVGPTETHDIGKPELSLMKVGQAEPGTARVVLHLGENTQWRIACDSPSQAIAIVLNPKQSQVQEQVPVRIANIISMAVTSDERDRVELKVSADANLSPKAFSLLGPYRVCVDFPNAELAGDAPVPAIQCPLVKSARLGKVEAKSPTVRVVLELTRILAYSIIRHGPNEVSLLVRIPDNAGGRLADTSVVIDPGHGGDDPGTQWGSIREKDVTLSMAQRVAEKLRALGARVRLTREADVYVTLRGRPKVAEDAGADLFVSLHCNSNSRPDSASGTETYYHKQDPSSRALAMVVQTGVAEAIGLHDRGAKSDLDLRYTNGLAVLRCATVPAVLLEVGYLNHSSDRCKLADPAFQETVAKGIVSGLRRYIEGEGSYKEESVELEASAKP